MSATTVHAKHESRCGDCHGTIRPGDVIKPGASSFWEHAVCPPGALDIVREVCQECWTEKSVTGTCMCVAS